MKKHLFLVAIICLNLCSENFIEVRALSTIPQAGEYALSIEMGPKNILLGDVLIDVPAESSLLKFSSPSIDSHQKSIPVTYGILNLTEPNDQEFTLNYIFYQTGYIKDSTLSLEWIREMFGNLLTESEEKITLITLENTVSYVIIQPDTSNQERSFSGIFPSRNGILLFSYESSLSDSYEQGILTFHRFMNKMQFIPGTEYIDYIEGEDLVYDKTLKGFLKEFVVTPLLSATDNEDEPTTTPSINVPTNEIPNPFFEKIFDNSNTTNVFNSPPTPTTPGSNDSPNWILLLGIFLILWGAAKGILKKLREPNITEPPPSQSNPEVKPTTNDGLAENPSESNDQNSPMN